MRMSNALVQSLLFFLPSLCQGYQEDLDDLEESVNILKFTY